MAMKGSGVICVGHLLSIGTNYKSFPVGFLGGAGADNNLAPYYVSVSVIHNDFNIMRVLSCKLNFYRYDRE